MIGVVVAALTDWATYRLSSKLMGPGSAAGAVSPPPYSSSITEPDRIQFFLSVTSLFHAHVLPRSLSNSPETLLTTLALVYFPFRQAGAPKAIIVGDGGLVASQSMKDVTKAKAQMSEEDGDNKEVRYEDVGDINYAVMDRLGPDVVEQEGFVVFQASRQIRSYADSCRPLGSLVLSLFFAGLAMCIRTTTLPLWLYLGPEYLIRVTRQHGFAAGVYVGWLALLTG